MKPIFFNRKSARHKMKGKRRTTKRRTTKRRTTKRRTTKGNSKMLRGGTVNPISEIGSMFGTLGSSLQSVVSSLSVPLTTAFNPPLPINAAPSSQYLTPPLTQSISSIFKSI